MRRFFIVFVASLMFGGSAYAMPSGNENHVHSYTFYAPKPASAKVVSRNQNIPAPSHWVPPERIPVRQLVRVTRQQPPRVGSASSFSNPTFSNPTSSSPNFSNPSYSNPTASSPPYSNPNYSNPDSTSPTFSNPTSASPTYSNPSYSAPTSDL